MSVMSPTEPTATPRLLVRAVGVSGLAALVLGLLLLVVPFTTLATIAVILGIQLLILGAVRVVRAFRSRHMDGWVRGGHLLFGVIVAALGVVCFIRPFTTVAVLLILVGIAWIIDGAADVLSAWRSPEGRGGAVIGTLFGVISIVAGIIVVARPVASVTAFATLGGVFLLILGIVQLSSASRLRRQLEA